LASCYPDDKPVPKEGGKITVKYYVYEFDYIKVVVERAVFCEQEVYILCNGTERPQNRGDYDDWVVTGDGKYQTWFFVWYKYVKNVNIC
jgi:hypothetical protein